MIERIAEELELIRAAFPNLEFREEDFWGRLCNYPVPPGWGREETEIAFQMPQDPFGQEPYGFWVRPFLALPGGGQPSNTSPDPVATGFGEGWQQFSWSPENWSPRPQARCGSNMLDFVHSFARRLSELN